MKKSIKTIYFGDSIMASDSKPYHYDNDNNQPDKNKLSRGYPTLLNEKLGLVNIGNFAVGGQTIKQQLEIILTKDLKDAELCIISVGINDFSLSTKIGSLPKSTNTEFDENTFYGAYCKALHHIFTSNPFIKVVLMTPLHRDTLKRKPPARISGIDTVVNGNRIIDFVNAIRNIGEFFSCPVADMYANCGLNRYNLPKFTFEGVHPTNKGYEFITPTLINTVKSIFWI